ncbi:hypothetical protein OZX56_08280 [Lactobacillus sp. ESL0684]|uniref:hypothetical protein n=1 Tax=unclassified Lactobacillus TaxID=2620435 RepID=UPI0023FA1F52|nr:MULTISPECIES: hypothetical protein [unclassified Lactobacillus]WEV39969.1 hypothetical protein OZX59_07095 [Lactobacillus sp. ESL0681]WEV43489.1 hypothetical protein OZX56_08280 [Lactobacillus sp. ESL0684]
MKQNNHKDHNNWAHFINRERKLNRLMSIIFFIYVSFLIMTLITDLALFMKTIFVTFIILVIYFIICLILNIYDKFKQKN